MELAMESVVNMDAPQRPTVLGTIVMVVKFHRPDFIPSSKAQRRFQCELNTLLKSSGSGFCDVLRAMTPPTNLQIPAELSMESMMEGKTSPVSLQKPDLLVPQGVERVCL